MVAAHTFAEGLSQRPCIRLQVLPALLPLAWLVLRASALISPLTRLLALVVLSAMAAPFPVLAELMIVCPLNASVLSLPRQANLRDRGGVSTGADEEDANDKVDNPGDAEEANGSGGAGCPPAASTPSEAPGPVAVRSVESDGSSSGGGDWDCDGDCDLISRAADPSGFAVSGELLRAAGASASPINRRSSAAGSPGSSTATLKRSKACCEGAAASGERTRSTRAFRKPVLDGAEE
mmetsp:Transcript_65108/g.201930  ORF Transcript_65108/g.201930 Transcript_65108/m.201930 type:complete len:236 (-) Transcript_65108:251-958(-)